MTAARRRAAPRDSSACEDLLAGGTPDAWVHARRRGRGALRGGAAGRAGGRAGARRRRRSSRSAPGAGSRPCTSARRRRPPAPSCSPSTITAARRRTSPAGSTTSPTSSTPTPAGSTPCRTGAAPSRTPGSRHRSWGSWATPPRWRRAGTGRSPSASSTAGTARNRPGPTSTGWAPHVAVGGLAGHPRRVPRPGRRRATALRALPRRARLGRVRRRRRLRQPARVLRRGGPRPPLTVASHTPRRRRQRLGDATLGLRVPRVPASGRRGQPRETCRRWVGDRCSPRWRRRSAARPGRARPAGIRRGTARPPASCSTARRPPAPWRRTCRSSARAWGRSPARGRPSRSSRSRRGSRRSWPAANRSSAGPVQAERVERQHALGRLGRGHPVARRDAAHAEPLHDEGRPALGDAAARRPRPRGRPRASGSTSPWRTRPWARRRPGGAPRRGPAARPPAPSPGGPWPGARRAPPRSAGSGRSTTTRSAARSASGRPAESSDHRTEPSGCCQRRTKSMPALDRRPQLAEQLDVAGDQVVVPGPGRHVGADVGVEPGVLDAVAQVVVEPAAVGELAAASQR